MVAVAFPRKAVAAVAVPVEEIPPKAVLAVAEAEVGPVPEEALAVAETFMLPVKLMEAVPEPLAPPTAMAVPVREAAVVLVKVREEVAFPPEEPLPPTALWESVMLPVVEAERTLLRMESGAMPLKDEGVPLPPLPEVWVMLAVMFPEREEREMGLRVAEPPAPARIRERVSFPPLPPLAIAVRVMLEVVVEMLMGEMVAFPPLPATDVRKVASPPLPPVAERVELLSVVGLRVAEALAFPPLELGAPLPPVAVMVLEGSEEVTVAEASWPVPGAPDSMSEAAWRVEWMARVRAEARRSLGSLGVGIFSPMRVER